MPKKVATVFVEARLDPKSLATINTQLRAALTSGTGSGPFITGTRATTALANSQSTLGRATSAATRSLHEQADVIERNSGQLNRFSRGVASTGLSMFGLRGATLAATSAFLAGAAGITAIGKAVGIATSFNSQLAVFAATTGATADQMAQVSEKAKALGADLSLPGVTASDAAEAMTELAKAGLSVADAIAGAQGVLQLGKAANIDFAAATELAASAINAFQLSGEDATHVADVFANAANSAQGSILDVAIALQQAAAVGHQVGLSFEDTQAFVTQLALAGLKGSDAGTSLRTALVRLINPTKKAAELLKQLGVEARDAEGNLRPDFFVNLGIAIQGETKAQRDQILATLGGQDAVRAYAILTRQSLPAFLAQREALHQQGTAAKLAAARMVGLAGAGAGLSNTVSTLALNLGQKATPALVGLTGALTDTIQATASSPLVTGTLGDAAHAVADAFGLLGTAIRTVAPVLGTVATGISKVVGAIGVGQIIAAVVAFKALKVAMASLAGGRLLAFFVGMSAAAGTFARFAGLLAVQLRIATASMVGFRAVSLSLAPILLNMFTPQGAIIAGLAVLSAGLFYAFTQESTMEKATKRLKTATEDLADAFNKTDTAAEAVGRAKLAEATDRAALAENRLALARAKTALAKSTAPAGSLEQEQLKAQVAVLTQDVSFGQQQLADSAENVKVAQEQAAAATELMTKQLHAMAAAITGVDAAARSGAFGGKNLVEIFRPKEADIMSLDKVLQKLREEKDALLGAAAAGDKGAIEIRRRITLITGLLPKLAAVNRNAAIHILLDTKSVERGAGVLSDFLGKTGDTAGQKWLASWYARVTPQSILSPLGNLPGLFASLGAQSGASFSNALIGFIQRALSLANLLVRNAGIAAASRLSNQTATLLQNVDIIAAQGGSLEAQLAAAKLAQARADKLLKGAIATAKTGRRGDAQEALDDAVQKAGEARGKVTALEGQIAAEQKAGASSAASAAKDAQQALDDADRAFLDAMGLKRGKIDIEGAKAELTKSLVDDLAFQRHLQVFFTKQIAETLKTIHDALLRAQTVQTLKLALLAAQKAAADLVANIKENKQQRIRDRRDRKQESLELNIEIAQAQENKNKELKAHQALLKFLRQRQDHTTAGTVEYRRLQLKIEQEKAAIKELQKSKKSQNDALKSLEFEFLQAQTGFVANLLGNLLPTSAVAGTLGGGATASTTPVPGGVGSDPFPFGTDARDRRNGIDAGMTDAAKTAGGPQAVSAGQMSTLIAIARAQLNVMKGGSAQTAHPEAKRAWAWSGTEMLNTGF